jgi:hypothetical protein
MTRSEETVVFVGELGEGCDRVQWLLVSRAKPRPPCGSRLRPVAADEEGWRLYRRIER